MSYKKIAIFLTIFLLSLFSVIFLLIYEQSPLNRYFREKEAQELYNQALEFHEIKDYSSAIHIFEELIDKDYRGFYGHYYDTQCAKNAQMQADELLPVWYCEWAEEIYAEGKYGQAVGLLSVVLSRYPEYQSEYIASRIRDMEIDTAGRAKNAMEITLPDGTSKNLNGRSELIIINDSPEQLRVFLRGPENMSISIDANNASSHKIVQPLPGFGVRRDVNETLLLPSGDYEMAIDAHLVIPAYGEFKLLGDRSYELIFYVLKHYT